MLKESMLREVKNRCRNKVFLPHSQISSRMLPRVPSDKSAPNFYISSMACVLTYQNFPNIKEIFCLSLGYQSIPWTEIRFRRQGKGEILILFNRKQKEMGFLSAPPRHLSIAKGKIVTLPKRNLAVTILTKGSRPTSPMIRHVHIMYPDRK